MVLLTIRVLRQLLDEAKVLKTTTTDAVSWFTAETNFIGQFAPPIGTDGKLWRGYYVNKEKLNNCFKQCLLKTKKQEVSI